MARILYQRDFHWVPFQIGANSHSLNRPAKSQSRLWYKIFKGPYHKKEEKKFKWKFILFSSYQIIMYIFESENFSALFFFLKRDGLLFKARAGDKPPFPLVRPGKQNNSGPIAER